jgi:hypothetical protein
MQDIKSIGELVRHLHAPFPSRLELAVETLQNLASHDGSFPPSGVLVRQFLALVINLGPVVIDVKEVSRHLEINTDTPRLVPLGAALLRRAIELRNRTVPLPKLDIMAVDVLPGGFNCSLVIRAIKLDRPHEMAVAANDVNPIISHLRQLSQEIPLIISSKNQP